MEKEEQLTTLNDMAFISANFVIFLSSVSFARELLPGKLKKTSFIAGSIICAAHVVNITKYTSKTNTPYTTLCRRIGS
jgi:hypothetical protein